MTTSREKVNSILNEIENKAYRKGWESAMKEFEAWALQHLTNKQDKEGSKEEKE